MRVALKLVMAVLVLVVCMLAIEARLRASHDAEVFADDMRRNQHVLGTALRAAVELVWRTHGPLFARDVLEASEAGEREIRVRLVGLDPGAPDPPRVELRPDDREHLRHGEEVVQMTAGDPAFLFTYVPINLPQKPGAALELSTSMREQGQLVRAGVLRFSVVALAIVIVVGAVTMLLGRRIVGQPIQALVEHARSVGSGDLGHRTTIVQHDEIGELAHALDTMAGRLGQAQRELHVEAQARAEATLQLRHADRLAAVGTLAAGIAHELGTPLHVVAGRARLAQQRTPDPDVHHDAEVIVLQCDRMQKIVQQLLTFARASSETRRVYDLGELVQRSAELVKPLLASHGIQLHVWPGEVPHVEARVAGEPIEQVLTNLYINAAHAMPGGGTIDVRIERADPPRGITLDPAGAYACIAVEDEGTGIDESILDRIFDPFFTTKDVGRGTGLGLSVAHGIVRDHGGALRARNRPEGGSRFEIWLPEAP